MILWNHGIYIKDYHLDLSFYSHNKKWPPAIDIISIPYRRSFFFSLSTGPKFHTLTATSEYVEEIKSLPVKRQVSVSGTQKKLGVSRSGYNAWKKRVPSDTSVRRAMITAFFRSEYFIFCPLLISRAPFKKTAATGLPAQGKSHRRISLMSPIPLWVLSPRLLRYPDPCLSVLLINLFEVLTG